MKAENIIGQKVKFYAVIIAEEIETWSAIINPNGWNTKILEGIIIDENHIGVNILFNNTNQWVLKRNIIQ